MFSIIIISYGRFYRNPFVSRNFANFICPPRCLEGVANPNEKRYNKEK